MMEKHHEIALLLTGFPGRETNRYIEKKYNIATANMTSIKGLVIGLMSPARSVGKPRISKNASTGTIIEPPINDVDHLANFSSIALFRITPVYGAGIKRQRNASPSCDSSDHDTFVIRKP